MNVSISFVGFANRDNDVANDVVASAP